MSQLVASKTTMLPGSGGPPAIEGVETEQEGSKVSKGCFQPRNMKPVRNAEYWIKSHLL